MVAQRSRASTNTRFSDPQHASCTVECSKKYILDSDRASCLATPLSCSRYPISHARRKEAFCKPACEVVKVDREVHTCRLPTLAPSEAASEPAWQLTSAVGGTPAKWSWSSRKAATSRIAPSPGRMPRRSPWSLEPEESPCYTHMGTHCLRGLMTASLPWSDMHTSTHVDSTVRCHQILLDLQECSVGASCPKGCPATLRQIILAKDGVLRDATRWKLHLQSLLTPIHSELCISVGILALQKCN